MPLKFIDFLRSLTFGGLVGVGLAGLIYPHLPDYYHSLVTVYQFIIFGGFLGGSTHQLIETLVKYAVLPATRTVLFYEKILELTMLERIGRIDSAQRKAIEDQLTKDRFLGDTRTEKPQLLPKPND